MRALAVGLGSGGLYAWRGLRQARWYIATVLGVVAAGISLATTVFAVVDGTLFKPLPFPDAERVFAVDLAYSRPTEPPVGPRAGLSRYS